VVALGSMGPRTGDGQIVPRVTCRAATGRSGIHFLAAETLVSCYAAAGFGWTAHPEPNSFSRLCTAQTSVHSELTFS